MLNHACVEEKINNFSCTFKDTQAIWVFKDLQSNFLYANPFCVNFLGYKKPSKLIGKTDSDLLWCDFSKLYKQEERETLESKSYTSLVPSTDKKGGEVLFFSSRDLVFDNTQNPIGILCQARPITNKNTLELSNLLHSSIIRSTSNPKQPFTPERKPNNSLSRTLTKCERECLFFLIRGNSAKMVANTLCRSQKSIEFHVENLKQKFQVKSKFELTAKAIHEGYLHEIPSSLYNKQLTKKLKSTAH